MRPSKQTNTKPSNPIKLTLLVVFAISVNVLWGLIPSLLRVPFPQLTHERSEAISVIIYITFMAIMGVVALILCWSNIYRHPAILSSPTETLPSQPENGNELFSVSAGSQMGLWIGVGCGSLGILAAIASISEFSGLRGLTTWWLFYIFSLTLTLFLTVAATRDNCSYLLSTETLSAFRFKKLLWTLKSSQVVSLDYDLLGKLTLTLADGRSIAISKLVSDYEKLTTKIEAWTRQKSDRPQIEIPSKSIDRGSILLWPYLATLVVVFVSIPMALQRKQAKDLDREFQTPRPLKALPTPRPFQYKSKRLGSFE